MRLLLTKLLNGGAIMIALLLLTSCVDNPILTPPLESDSCLPASEPETVPETVSWQVRCISSRIYGLNWTVIDNKLWYLDNNGISYLDTETGIATTVSDYNVFNTMFVVDDNIWFAYNYSSAHNYEGIDESQIPLARFDLISEQYYEYPTDIFTGVNVTVLKSLGKVMVCADNKLFQYDKVTGQFINMPEYGEDIWRIAGNEEVLAIYTGVYTGDSLEIYKANGELVQYNPANYLPNTFVTSIHIVGNELFICWGGEGEPAGVACLNMQTGAWAHFIDPVLEKNFSTLYEYTLISGYGGISWHKEEDVVYLFLTNDLPSSLLKFSFSRQQFECVYTAEKRIYDAMPFQNGIVIYQYPELVFYDADNSIEYILEDVVVQELIKKDQNTILAITEEGIFECKLAK